IFATVSKKQKEAQKSKKALERAPIKEQGKKEGKNNLKKVRKHLEERKETEKGVFQSSHRCKNATVNATLTDAIDIKQFKAMKNPHKDILIFMWKKKGKTLQSDLASYLKRDKSTVSRYLDYLAKKGL